MAHFNLKEDPYMRRTTLGRGALAAIAVLLAAPAGALAQDGPTLETLVSE